MGAPLRRDEMTIIPIERSRASVDCDRVRVHAHVAKEVAAIVIVAADGAQALGPSGEPVDVAGLLLTVSGLREALEASRSGFAGAEDGARGGVIVPPSPTANP